MTSVGTIVRGALAGLSATVPMSAMMEFAANQLPWHERYPLPPRLITHRLARRMNLDQDVDDNSTKAATLVAHFGYGAAMGAIYDSVVPRNYVGPSTGIAFGLGVWAGSYLGLLPSLGILTPATDHPGRRTALMIAAHVVWGAALGRAAQTLDTEE